MVFAVALDALGLSWTAFGLRVQWLEIAALGCLGAAATLPGALRDRRAWSTAIDGPVLAGVLVAAAQLIPGSGAEHAAFPLRQVLACAAIYYGLAAQLRRSAEAVERLWDVFAFAGVLASGHALFAVTSGLGALRASSLAADQGWGSNAGLFKSLVFLTVLFVGRALESRSSRGWNVLTLLATIAVVLLGVAAGTGLGSAALARLDDPLHFSSIVVLLLVLSGLLKGAWELRRARSEQASRWRGAGGAVLALGVIAVFGGASGGEPLRALGTLLAALLVAAPEAGATEDRPEGEGRAEPPVEPPVYGKAA
ncbi:MAG: hypothetical protein HZA61_16035 [Candidatus Eisenbacteria bacterium]|uniref:Uncharacterized protein n=1 Tax=Eiseniibacteriota bacterium TaxID=2212470 RepID=A0A933WAG5_UNCEI|nr:hypothetical protein [Candidatus Eisenbacteria bacterium]